jgi:hypothetical protein
MFLMFGMCDFFFCWYGRLKVFIGLMIIVAIWNFVKDLDMKFVGLNLGQSKWIVYQNPKNTLPFLVTIKRPRPKSFNFKIS